VVRCKLCGKKAETVEEYCKYVVRFIRREPDPRGVSENIVHFLLCSECIRKLASVMQDPELMKFLGG